MISRALMILVIIISLPVVSILQLPPKVMAQVPPSERAKVLVDDIIEALKSNDINRAQIHLNLLNQQLPTFVNSSSLQSVKVLLDDTASALKNNDVNKAIVHLNLIEQQFANPANNSRILNTIAKNPANNVTSVSNNLLTYKNSTYGITSIQYPSDWTINETNVQPNITSGFDVVSFFAPHEKRYPPGQSPATVQVSLSFPDDPNAVSNLTKFVHDIVSNDSSVTSYNTSATLAGLPAYSVQYTAVDVINSTITVLDVGTVVSGKQLVMHYIAEPSRFSTFLPTALKIINSLKIDKAAIEQLTAPY